MRVTNARQHALEASADGYDAAKAAHEHIHHDLLNEYGSMGVGDVNEHEAALRLLEADYPQLKRGRASQQRRARRDGERELEHEHGARTRTPQRTRSQPKTKTPPAGPKRVSSAADRASSRAAGTSRRAGARLYRETYNAAGAGPASRYVLHLIGAGFALSLGLLLLRNPRAVELGVGSFVGGFRALVSPYSDPLSPTHQLRKRPAAIATGAGAARAAATVKPSVNPTVNPLAAGPRAPAAKGRVLPNLNDLLGATPGKTTIGGTR